MIVLTILGTRPQLIKSQMVSKELRKIKINEKIINTMQHYDKNLNQSFYNKNFSIKALYKKKNFKKLRCNKKITNTNKGNKT